MDDYLIMSSLSGPAPVPGPPLDPGLVMVDPEAQAASHPAPGLQPDLPQQPPVSFPGAPPGHEINFANEVGNAFCLFYFLQLFVNILTHRPGNPTCPILMTFHLCTTYTTGMDGTCVFPN